MPRVTTEAMSVAVAAFVRDERIDVNHRAVLVVDQPGRHLAPDLVLPGGIDLVVLPAYSPELQPAEWLWGLVD